MSYGLAYGLSLRPRQTQLNISSDEAGELRTNYFKRFGRVGRFLRGVLKQAHQDGYRNHFRPPPRAADLDSQPCAMKPPNAPPSTAPIQGTAADIIKIAMINIHRRLRERGPQDPDAAAGATEYPEVATGEREATERVLVEEMSGAASCVFLWMCPVGWGKSGGRRATRLNSSVPAWKNSAHSGGHLERRCSALLRTESGIRPRSYRGHPTLPRLRNEGRTLSPSSPLRKLQL